MKVYYVANSRKICSTADQAIALALRDIGLHFYNQKDRYVVSKPMIIENTWGTKRVVVTIYDKNTKKLKIRKRKIDIVNLDDTVLTPIEYLGEL